MMKRLLLGGVVISIFSFLSAFSFAEEPRIEGLELIPLSRIKGTISLKNFGPKEYLVLTTSEGKRYALIGEIADEKIRPLPDLETKELALVGIESPLQREISDIEYIYDSKGALVGEKKSVFRFKELEVVYIEWVEEAKERVEAPPAVVEEEPQTVTLSKLALSQALKLPAATLHKIKGEVISCNLGVRALIPTLEVEYKTKGRKHSLIVIVPKDAKVIKVIDEKPMELMPTVIKVGNKVDMWYEQRGDRNFARIITILEPRDF